MDKKIFAIILFCFSILPIVALGQGLVPCNTGCTLNDFFIMLGNIYRFIVNVIAAPLATLAILIGAFFMITSAGNPNRFARGKQILLLAVIGMLLAFGSSMLIKAFLGLLGYQYANSLPN
jgi:uncharacterized membrane protein